MKIVKGLMVSWVIFPWLYCADVGMASADNSHSNGNRSSAMPVKVEPVMAITPSKRLQFSAHVHGYHNSQLGTLIGGELQWVASPGVSVKKGEVVARIDPTELELQHSEKQAEVERHAVNVHYLDGEFERVSNLLKTNNAALTQVDELRFRRDTAKADWRIATSSLKQIQHQLDQTHIVAPFDGMVVERYRQVGEVVNRAERLVRLVSDQDLELRGFIPVSNRPDMTKGSRIEWRNSAGKQMQIPLGQVVNFTNDRSQQVEIRSRLSIPQSAGLVPGQWLPAELLMPQDHSALAVHRDALLLREEGAFVVIIDDDGKAKRISVKTGREQGETVIIEGNLKVGDPVAIRGAERLTDGDRVVISG